ncbi:hypothetical protein LCGC14_0546710 [marine sediment metagenome]|uniref:Proliferating cell nuclear antigen PCNA N-terminal domain-containing protein n=1 Tax=marine sediment metagenome TaxID=412755 RepID=A0A0F9UCL5_9ZZZZ
MSEEKSKVVGFKLPQNIIMDILNHLRTSGTTLAGENVTLADDCIIRVANNVLLSITTDEGRKIIMQVKINKSKFKDLQILNKGLIPINIEITKKFLSRFSSSDSVEVVYENGMISFKRSNPDFPPLEIFMSTKRINSIQCDFFSNLKKQIDNEKSEKDKKLLEFFKKHKSIYFIEKDGSANIFGVKLDNFIEVACGHLKEVVKDGELLENRIYPFTVVDGKLNVTVKSIKEENLNRISRGIYVKSSSFTSDFSTTYSSQFNAAISSTRGHIQLYFGEDKPLLLIKQSDSDRGIDMSYIVMPYIHKK